MVVVATADSTEAGAKPEADNIEVLRLVAVVFGKGVVICFDCWWTLFG